LKKGPLVTHALGMEKKLFDELVEEFYRALLCYSGSRKREKGAFQSTFEENRMNSLVRIFVATSLLIGLLAFSLTGPDPTAQESAKGSPRASAPAKSNQPEKPVPPYYKSAKAAGPLPATLPPSHFADRPVVVTAYTIAQKIPKVLVQQPCYCGCDKHFGHHSLLDCYTSEHTAGCGICVKETFLTWEMTRQHKTPAQIRAAIMRGDFNSVDINHPPTVAP
jgi:uncharacterized protein with PCYCGC motif